MSFVHNKEDCCAAPLCRHWWQGSLILCKILQVKCKEAATWISQWDYALGEGSWELRDLPTWPCIAKDRPPQNHQNGFLTCQPSHSHTGLALHPSNLHSRKENMTTINFTWQMERKAGETAECADSSDAGGQQSWDQNSVWPDWNSPGGALPQVQVGFTSLCSSG